MEGKKGISLVVLVVTIIIMIILTGITIVGMENVIAETERDEFITELAVLKDKTKEYYILMGKLPVKDGSEYTATELSNLLNEQSHKTALLDEITKNKDTNNKFLIIDLSLMDIKTSKRGREEKSTDVFCVAINTLNIYYIDGIIIDGSIRFSLANLIESKDIENDPQSLDSKVELDKSLALIKNTESWTNEIRLQIKCEVQNNQKLQYSICGQTSKIVPSNNVIVINSNTMTLQEKAAFSDSKQINVSKLENGDIIDSKQVGLVNLDISSPQLPIVEIMDTSNEDVISLKISSTDIGGSGIKTIYYDFVNKVVDGVEQPYYYYRSKITEADLINFGKKSGDGLINIPKNISRIACISVDHAGNPSEILNYSILDN